MARAARLDESLDDAAHVGLAVALLLPDAVEVHLRGTSREGVPVTADDVFPWGSITKTVTGTLLALLADEGAVALDTPLSDVLPGTPPLLLADLASHTAGLKRLLPSALSYVRSHDKHDPYADETPERLLEALSRTTLKPPRVRYSNAGAGLLGLALVTATGTPYAELVRTRVAEPLGLTTLTTADVPALVQGHDRKRQPVPHWRFTDAMAGCGALRGSVRDLLTWVTAAGTGEAPEPLAAALRTATTPRAADRAIAVGLGWCRSVPGGLTGLKAPPEGEVGWVWHDGAVAGATAFTAYDPSRGLAVAVLANAAKTVTPFGVELLRG